MSLHKEYQLESFSRL